MKFPLIKDSKGESSTTMTAFVVGFIIVNVKLLLSGMVIKGFTFEVFTGSSYSMAIASLGAIYVLRRSTDKKVEDDQSSK
jgi:hypothetical protein